MPWRDSQEHYDRYGYHDAPFAVKGQVDARHRRERRRVLAARRVRTDLRSATYANTGGTERDSETDGDQHVLSDSDDDLFRFIASAPDAEEDDRQVPHT